ncbi:MAG: F0F1 ATP synthase subunit A [Bacteroidota bacterium]
MLKLPFGLALALLVSLSLAPPAQAADDDEPKTLDAVGHTADGNYLDFLPFTKVELPRLFVTRGADGGLRVDAFGTSKAAILSDAYTVKPKDEASPEGTEAGPIDESTYLKSAYKANIVAAGGSEIVIDLSPTRHVLFAVFAMTILCITFFRMAGKYKRGVGRESAPKGIIQNSLETVVLYIRDEVARPNLGEKTNRYLPYLLTVFFFILLCNLLGLVPFGATATSNIAITAVLAVFTFVITQIAGTKDYWGHIFNPPGVPVALKPILIPVEFLGLFTKPFALAVRLFANLTAGHLIILNLIGLIFLIRNDFGVGAGWGTTVPVMLMTLFVYCLEVLVAFIQAYVFTMLSALFIGMAAAEHEHDHDHSEDHGLTTHDIAVAHANGQTPHKLHERTVGTEAAMA